MRLNAIGDWAGPGLVEDAPKDGWFHTGDFMRQDEKGNLWFVSRKKQLIIRGGSNISPVEVEHVLITHPAVRDAAVVGVPDPELGQRVAGFVQLASSAHSVNLSEIRPHVAEQIADYNRLIRTITRVSDLILQRSLDRSAIFAASISVIGFLGGPHGRRVLTCPVV
jgi:long-chain acyl-CoA synthetase